MVAAGRVGVLAGLLMDAAERVAMVLPGGGMLCNGRLKPAAC